MDRSSNHKTKINNRITIKTKNSNQPLLFFLCYSRMRKETKERIERVVAINNKAALRKTAKIVGIAAIILITIIIFRNIILKVIYPQKYSEYVEKYAKEYQVDKELIYAMIKAESNFRKEAVSNKEAIGLMQILESTANEVAKELEKEVTKEELLNPDLNICLGTKYISNLIKKYNNIELAIAAYNAGIGNVDTWIKEGIIQKDGSDIENIPFKETNNYLRKILRDYKLYRQLYK